MNRVLRVRHPLFALSVTNARLPPPSFIQPYCPYTPRREFLQNLFLRFSSSLPNSSSVLHFRMDSEKHKNQPGISPLTTSATFCTANKDLSIKKCVPCNTKDLRPMTENAAHTLIPQVPEWYLVNEGGSLKLRRSWKVKSFTKGLEFFRIVADLAQAEGHHPDLHLVGWNNVTIEIWTHSAGGLTENDFILAAKIDELNVHDLLGRKASD